MLQTFVFSTLQISSGADSHPVAMSTSSLRRQVKNIVHNYSEAEIKVRGLHLLSASNLFACVHTVDVPEGVIS